MFSNISKYYDGVVCVHSLLVVIARSMILLLQMPRGDSNVGNPSNLGAPKLETLIGRYFQSL